MSADILRRAAALMRRRAETATPGPWMVDDDNPHIVMRPDKPGFSWDGTAVTAIQGDDFGLTDHADAEHIAAWHPLVAVAAAAWLEHYADEWCEFPGTSLPEDDIAVNFARAYLGEAAP